MRIPDAIHEELVNWSRWCWLGEWPHPLPATHCGSLESQYKTPPEWDMDLAEAPPAPYIRPNERHARIVQEAYDSMPPAERMILQAEYPGRHKYRGRTHAATVLGHPMWAYEELLSSAIFKVEEAFEVRV